MGANPTIDGLKGRVEGRLKSIPRDVASVTQALADIAIMCLGCRLEWPIVN